MKYLILLLPFLMLACSSSSKNDTSGAIAKFEEDLTIGKKLRATRYGDIYFSAQPSDEDIAALKAQGFAHIVNFRHKSEYDEKAERNLAMKSGLSYTYAPFKQNKEIKEKYLDYVVKRIGKHRSKGKTLIHCSSGNRVAAWAGIHFFRDHGYSQEAAISIAKKIGLEDADLMEKVTKYTAKKDESPEEMTPEDTETPADTTDTTDTEEE